MVDYVPDGSGVPTIYPNGPVMHHETDITMTHKGVTASIDAAVIMYLSYGPKIPWKGGPIITRRVVAGTDLVADEFTVLDTSPINDLNPLRSYRVHGGCAVSEDTWNGASAFVGAARLSSPSFGGRKILLPGSMHFSMASCVFFDGIHGPNDSLLVQGWDNITVEGFVGAVQSPVVYVFLEDYGPATKLPNQGGLGIAGGSGGSQIQGDNSLLQGREDMFGLNEIAKGIFL